MTPEFSNTLSLGAGVLSREKVYWYPLHPPPSTATRSTDVDASSAASWRNLATHASVRVMPSVVEGDDGDPALGRFSPVAASAAACAASRAPALVAIPPRFHESER